MMSPIQSTPGTNTKPFVVPTCNQPENEQEPEIIGEICNIRKNLTFHLARHTFATTVTLMDGVPIETISKILGHTFRLGAEPITLLIP